MDRGTGLQLTVNVVIGRLLGVPAEPPPSLSAGCGQTPGTYLLWFTSPAHQVDRYPGVSQETAPSGRIRTHWAARVTAVRGHQSQQAENHRQRLLATGVS